MYAKALVQVGSLERVSGTVFVDLLIKTKAVGENIGIDPFFGYVDEGNLVRLKGLQRLAQECVQWVFHFELFCNG